MTKRSLSEGEKDAVRAQARADYQRSPQLQSEFPSADNYAAFAVANASGSVRIAGNRPAGGA